MTCLHENLKRNVELFKETGNSSLLLFLDIGKIYAEIYTCMDCGALIARQVGGKESE